MGIENLDEAKDAQQQPQQDSGLQTPQPDQPIPSEPRPLEDEQASDDTEPVEDQSADSEPLQHDHDDN